LEMRVLQTICPGWPWNLILLISDSQIARITSVSHWCLAMTSFLKSRGKAKSGFTCLWKEDHKFEANLGYISEILSQIKKGRKGLVERPSKQEVLSSNPSTTKKLKTPVPPKKNK
jgi:hypothetical protein